MTSLTPKQPPNFLSTTMPLSMHSTRTTMPTRGIVGIVSCQYPHRPAPVRPAVCPTLTHPSTPRVQRSPARRHTTLVRAQSAAAAEPAGDAKPSFSWPVGCSSMFCLCVCNSGVAMPTYMPTYMPIMVYWQCNYMYSIPYTLTHPRVFTSHTSKSIPCIPHPPHPPSIHTHPGRQARPPHCLHSNWCCAALCCPLPCRNHH